MASDGARFLPAYMLFLTIFVSITLISLWVYVRRGRSLKRAVLVGFVLQVGTMSIVWGGPLSSGALFLLLPVSSPSAPSDLPLDFRPQHRGHVDLATGLYVRHDDDIVLSRAPVFVWRRAYRSRDRIVRRLGVGTSHNADWYLMGEPSALKRVDLITEEGARIAFDRTSPGTSYMNAMFEHTATPTGFYGARLGWVGQSWALRFWNGSLAIFQSCDAPGIPCAIVSARDESGHIIQFHRDARGMLRSIQAGAQRLAFEYDEQNRITRAVHADQEAAYSYDDRGRLVQATTGGVTRSYRYGSRDEMIAVEEPNRSLENTYDSALRVTRQVVRRPGRADSTYSFEYTTYDGAIVETAVTNRRGLRTTYRWNKERRQDLEIHEGDEDSFVTVQYARPDGVFTQALTISCTNRGLPVTETVEVVPGLESRVKAEVIDRLCSE